MPYSIHLNPSAKRQLRIRSGDYRIIYRVSDQSPEVTVVHIGHRGEVYRKGV